MKNNFLFLTFIFLFTSTLQAMEGQWAQSSGTKRTHDEEQEQSEPSKRQRSEKISNEVIDVLMNLLKSSEASETILTAALVESVKSGDIKAVRLLIENGADIGVCDNNGDCLLHYAAAQGDYQMCECLLNQGIKDKLNYNSDVVSNTSESPIAVAVKNGHLKVTKLLVDWKVPMDFPREEEKPYLYSLRYAIKKGSIELVQVLMKHPLMMDKDVQASYEYGAIMRLALGYGYHHIAGLLIKRSVDFKYLLNSAMSWASWRGNKQVFNYFVNHFGANPNAVSNGYTHLQRLNMRMREIAQKANSES